MEDEDRQKPISITEIITEKKPVAHQGKIPMPISVGNSGGWGDKAMGGQRSYNKETDPDEIPNGAVIGARISHGRR
jgi:hypothetical protein